MAFSIDLAGRVFLVCGTSPGGIGGATARRIADAGGTVVAVDKDQVLIDAIIADINALGATSLGMVADVTDVTESETIVPAIIARFGRIDGVVNVAGGTREDEWVPLDLTSNESFRQSMALNFEYVFRICRDAAKEMIRLENPGSLVNVGSVSALTSAPWHGPYGAGKAAISALTRTMANEWHEFGIRANTVSPGATLSERVRNRFAAGGIPANVIPGEQNFTTIDELANAITFLLSDLASGISGQTLVVDRSLSTKFCGAARKTRKELA